MNSFWFAIRCFAVAALLGLTGCASAPPTPPKQVLEFERHTSAGLEKSAHGYVGQARGAFLRALAHAELDDSAGLIATALINLGSTELQLDQVEAAGRVYARAVREARNAQSPALEWQAQNGLAEATRRLGQPGKALELYAHRPDPGKSLTEALSLFAEVGRAQALADNGLPDQALAVLDGLETTARNRTPTDVLWPNILHARARILQQAKRLEEALAAAESALLKDRALHHPPSVADDHRLLSELLAAQSREDEAREHRDRAASIYTHTGQATRLKAVQPSPASSIR